MFEALSFHFCFLWTLWAWNENASTQTGGPARIKPLAWRPRLEEFKRFVRWVRLPHLPPGKKNVRSFNDLTGRKFGFLRVVEYAGTDRHRRRQWRVQCEQCGHTVTVLAQNLLSGRSKNCGCIRWLKARERMMVLMLAERYAAARAKGLTEQEAKVEIEKKA